MHAANFAEEFEHLTGNPPFPWQAALFDVFLSGSIPSSCDIPTGLGKTSVIAIWILAVARRARNGTAENFPRRLVYVVNRRTVVDQATRESVKMRRALELPELQSVANALHSLGIRVSDAPLAISTLRGQFADNAEWRNDPSRPAVVVGTVDMIGSRLLFAGYGCGFKSRPLHAGFLAQDSLLVHDEAHLEPAFQAVLESIVYEQHHSAEFRRLQVMALTATSRATGGQFGLSEADHDHHEIKKRIGAKKGLTFWPIDDEKMTPDVVVQRALAYKESGAAIIIFLRKLEQVEKVVEKLRKERLHVQPFTGTLRGLERDELATRNQIFARFMPQASSSSQLAIADLDVGNVDPFRSSAGSTVYLVCTSAGEVGVDISADHMVCDLSPFDSMAQRLGRVNRFGAGDAHVDVVHVSSRTTVQTAHDPEAQSVEERATEGAERATAGKKAKPRSLFDEKCERTYDLLRRLPVRQDERRDASPSALAGLPAADRRAAFTPEPTILPTTDILLDAWALTSIRERMPGRPPVADWLHGVAEWEPPQTYVAWRDEVTLIIGDLVEKNKPQDLLEDYPLKPHELLQGRADRVLEELKKLAASFPDLPVWLVDGDNSVDPTTLGQLASKDPQELGDCTVILSPMAGGLKEGMLDGNARFDQRVRYDVADVLQDPQGRLFRLRVGNKNEDAGDVTILSRIEGMRLVRTLKILTDAGDDADEGPRECKWYVRPRWADDDGSRTSLQRMELEPHLQSAADFAGALVRKLELKEPEASAVRLAALWHDMGKHRSVWQRSIGNSDYPNAVLAKSGGKGMRVFDLNAYRHEFGSLLDAHQVAEFNALTTESQDIVLHLIAAHHGRARPHFPTDESFDPMNNAVANAAITREVPRRFARLQRRYGRWGLAYLESLVRAADALASLPEESAKSLTAVITPATVSAQ